MKIQWSPLAIDRASDIADYISLDDPLAAERWVRALFDRVKQVKEFLFLPLGILNNFCQLKIFIMPGNNK